MKMKFRGLTVAVAAGLICATAGTVYVEDPAGGMGGSWSSVARYWQDSAANMLSYVDGRGYVW